MKHPLFWENQDSGETFSNFVCAIGSLNCISVAAASTKSINFYLESLLIWPTITFGFWRAKKEIKHEQKRENRKTCNLILQHVSLILFMENNNKKIFRREVENIALRVLTLWKRSLILVSSPCSYCCWWLYLYYCALMPFTTLCGEPWLNRIEQYTILKEISSAYNLGNFGSKARPTLNTWSYSLYYLLEVDGLFNQCREDFSLYFFWRNN